MKAVFLDQVGSEPRVGETERPRPGPGQVLIQVRAAGVNFADTMIRRGRYPYMPQLPHIPGMECAGVVREVGEGVDAQLVGRKVMALAQGCYAEYVCTPSYLVHLLPEPFSFQEGAAYLVNFMTAWPMLSRVARAREGETLLLHAAAGGVGTAALQLARHLGLRVIAMASRPSKLELARRLGAEHCIDYEKQDYVEEVKALTGGRGVDISLNPNGGEWVRRDISVGAPFGRLVIFGQASGELKALDLGPLFANSLSVHTFYLGTLVRQPEHYTRLERELTNIVVRTGIRPVLGQELFLEEAGEAWNLLESRQSTGKIVLLVGAGED